MPLTENDNVVKTLPSDRTDEPFSIISRISFRISGATVGRPPQRRDFQRQYDLKPTRCHFMTVSGFTIARAFMTVGANRYSPAKIKRSVALKVCLFGELRRSTLI